MKVLWTGSIIYGGVVVITLIFPARVFFLTVTEHGRTLHLHLKIEIKPP